MKKRRPQGASFIYSLSNLMIDAVPTKLDNAENQNYFSISKSEKEKEVMTYGMGIDEHESFWRYRKGKE
jgi:hypothetical protein